MSTLLCTHLTVTITPSGHTTTTALHLAAGHAFTADYTRLLCPDIPERELHCPCGFPDNSVYMIAPHANAHVEQRRPSLSGILYHHTTISGIPTHREPPGTFTTIPCCIQAAEQTGSPLQPWLRTDHPYPTTSVVLRLGEWILILYNLIQVVAFLFFGPDILYRAYVPYDDPSGRDLLTYFSDSLL